ncbi:uncharacterized protein YraI [Kibdelosporangium banguiense]|uniref:Uncharacterized protein YraI n=1 Tax=Kibdelosporangium banguiense TaxID=1365924 RepID=A0ABS4TSA8_9PSEU|nr:DUF6289 family protein [Kibdelosporangium banguiense]MBP2327300.1 uncharacterized protein YraI [Kibdelosporangium banguiense]
MIRRLLLVAATTLGVVAVMPAAQAQAIPQCRSGYTCLYQWYQDAAHTVFAGYLSVDCRGNSASSGTRTRYLEFNQARCNDL